MAIARFHNEGDLPTEPPPPPLTRRQGGIISPIMTTGEKNQRQLTEALNGLAAAINALAQAIVASFQPRETPVDPGGPGPAKGLTTQIRPTPDHRNPNARSNLGFAPVRLEMGDTEP